MDKYEYRVKTEQMLDYMEKKQYKKAMEIADTIDWRRVKNSTMLSTVSEIYECNGENQKSRDILFIAYDRAPESRKIVYRLGTLAVKLQDLQEAEDCYEEFVKVAPKDPNRYILKYKILKAKHAPIGKQIETLVEFKKVEYVEKWAYELAKLYQDAGMISECLNECDDLILWFSEGKYVLEAMKLKMQHKPLTPLQQEKYNHCVEVETKERYRIGDGNPEEMKELTPENTASFGESQGLEVPQEESEIDEEAEEAYTEEELPVETFDEMKAEDEVFIEVEDEPMEEAFVEEEMHEDTPEEEQKSFGTKSKIIQTTVAGATLAEALAKGIAAATGKELGESSTEVLSENAPTEHDFTEVELSENVLAENIPVESTPTEDIPMERMEEKLVEEPEDNEMREEAPMTAQEKLEGILQNWEEKQREVEKQIAEKKKQAEEEKAAREARQQRENMFNTAPIIPDDIQKLLDDLENGILDSDMDTEIDEEEMTVSGDVETFEEDFAEEDFTEEDYEQDEDFAEEEFDEEEFDEDDYEQDEDFVEEEFDEEDFAEDDYEQDEDFAEEEFDEEDFADEEEFNEEDFDEDDYEQDEDFSEEDFADKEEFDEEDFAEDDYEQDEDFNEEDFDEEDFDELIEDEDFVAEEFEIPEEDEEEEFEEEIDEEPEREKSALEQLEEEIEAENNVSPGGVSFDTGFVVQGRYDLDVQSEVGLKAGLTEEQKKLFSYFVPVRGMSEQIVEVLEDDKKCKSRYGTSRTGNILIVGRPGTGKTVLAVNVVKAIQKDRKLKQGKVAIVTGDALNKKELSSIINKLKGGALIIEKAGKMNTRTIRELNDLMEEQTGELLFVLEEQRKPLEKMLSMNPEFKRKFTSKLELPIFINDELVTFGQTYAKENGYKIDEMGILALYSRIDILQKEDHAVTVAEVKDIMDEAIDKAQRANVKHLMKRVFGKRTDNADRVILTEQDFK